MDERRTALHARRATRDGVRRARFLSRPQALLCACLLSVVTFCIATNFGRHIRRAPPLIDQIDRLLVASGWGINEIWLTGYRFAVDSELFAALALEDGRSLLRFDPRQARERLERLSWVDTAVVSRVFPNAVSVQIRERKPIAVWINAGRQALIDASGRVLAYIAPGVASDLPVVRGTEAAGAAASLLGVLRVHPDVAARLEAADRIGARRWTLRLDGGAKILLSADAPEESLRRLEELQQRQQVLDRAAVIDLRQPDRPVVRGGAFAMDAGAPPRGGS